MSQIRKVLSLIVEKDPSVMRAVKALRQFALAPMEAHEDIFGEEIAIEPGLFCFLLMFQREEEFQIIIEELWKKKISFEKAKDEILWSISENCESVRGRLADSIGERNTIPWEIIKPS